MWAQNAADDPIWSVTPILENSGSTPTRRMLSHVSLKVFNGPIPDDFDFPDLWDEGVDKKNRPGFLGPKGMTYMARMGVRLADLQKVENKWANILLYGWVDYDDVFDGPRHRFEFCTEVMVTGPLDLQNTTCVTPVIYERHNGADDECLKPPGVWIKPN